MNTLSLTNETYHALRSKLLPYIRCQCRNYGIDTLFAENIVHDALLTTYQLFEAGKTLNPTCSLATFATGIARNHVRTWFRKYNIAHNQPLDEATYAHKLISDDSNSEDNFAALEAILSLLAPKERKVLALYYLQGYSDKEVISQQLLRYKSPVVLRMVRKRILTKLQAKADVLGKMGYA